MNCLKCKEILPNHTADCPAAPKQRDTTAKPNGQRSPPTGKRISDHDSLMRAEYLPASGASFTIQQWCSVRVYDQQTRTQKNMPAVKLDNGKTLLLNLTNLRMLSVLFNDSEDESIGRAIRLQAGHTSAGKPTIVIEGAVALSSAAQQ